MGQLLMQFEEAGEAAVTAIKEEAEGAEYAAFVDKFKPKKTTDDCYTPPNIYEAVAGWVAEEYGLNRADFVRPFYPGGDYERFNYPPGAVVVDNPPFSILTQIVRFYLFKGIRFFLFAPALTLLSGAAHEVCAVCTQSDVVYANGAQVKTSFLTNLDPDAVRTAPELYRRIKAANDENLRAMRANLPKYVYPPEVFATYMCEPLSRLGIDFRIPRDKCFFIRRLDAQKKDDKAIFGGGYLLADSTAARLEAARHWPLSERERAICRALDKE